MLLGDARYERMEGSAKHYRDTETGKELSYRQALEAVRGTSPELNRDIAGGMKESNGKYSQEYRDLRSQYAYQTNQLVRNVEKSKQWQAIARDVFASFGNTKPGSKAHRKVWERKNNALKKLRTMSVKLSYSESRIYSPEVTNR